MNSLLLGDVHLQRIDVTKILRGALTIFEVLQLCNATLELGSSLLASFEDHLLVLIELSDQISGLPLLVVETVGGRQMRDVLRLESAWGRIIGVSCMVAAAIRGMLRSEVLAVVRVELHDLTLTLGKRPLRSVR